MARNSVDPVLARIVATVERIGIAVTLGPVPAGFLPGVEIRDGGLVVDVERLAHPGDVLHEAAHIAVMAPDARAACTGGALDSDPGEEMACHAWCYAAAKAFDLSLETVFHDAYRGGGPWLRETFEAGGLLGQPLLQAWDMTRLAQAPDGFDHLPLYPAMAKWLREA